MCGSPDSCSVLKLYGWLTDMYMIDHYTDDNWGKLPLSWKYFLQSKTPLTWTKILDLKQPLTEVVPLSLLALREIVRKFALPRDPIEGPAQLASAFATNTREIKSSFSSITSDNVLRVRMKKKKQHEVDRIIGLVEVLRSTADISFDSILDIGAGLGHLSRILAVKFPEISIRTVEGDAKLVDLANKMDSRFSRSVGEEFEAPSRELRFIDPDEDTSYLRQSDNGRSLIMGLHPCGDLSATILRSFLNYSDVTTLVLFGCCYHKLNGGQDKLCRQSYQESSPPAASSCSGFPLSRQLASSSLSYAARELGCHALEQFVDALKNPDKDESHYKIHCYRALLEWLVVETGTGGEDRLGLRHLSLRPVKRAHELAFEEYAEKALEDRQPLWHKVKQLILTSSVAQQKISELCDEWQRVFSIYCLRLLLAPVVESLIIRDRQLVIQENGYSVLSIPLFDPSISPRNIALVAWK